MIRNLNVQLAFYKINDIVMHGKGRQFTDCIGALYLGTKTHAERICAGEIIESKNIASVFATHLIYS